MIARLMLFPSIFQLPENVNIAKEARTAIGKAASVFVLYATSWYVIKNCGAQGYQKVLK